VKTVLFVLVGVALLLACGSPAEETKPPGSAMRLFSKSFEDGKPIPAVHSLDGGDQAPELHWTGVPAGAKSLAVLCDDLDAPGGSFTHWIAVDMLPVVIFILEGAPKTKFLVNGGIQGINSYGTLGWGGPKPPSGTHRYRFTLFALDHKPPVEEPPTREGFDAIVEGHTLATATLTGLFSAP